MGISPPLDQIPGFLVGIAVSTFFFVMRYKLQRPRLVVAGSTGTRIAVGSQEYFIAKISIYNSPRFLTFNIERSSAKVKSARVYDPIERMFVGHPLCWRSQEDGASLSNQATIEVGDSVELVVFAKVLNSNQFFVYSSRSMNEAPFTPNATFDDVRRNFVVELTDHINRRYRFRVQARNYNQTVSAIPSITIPGRALMISDAFGLIRSAFFRGWGS